MFCLKSINYGILIFSKIGFFLSLYAFKVEVAVENDANYTAMCDINEYVSCTKAFMSEYGKGFGIVKPLLGESSILYQPNSVFGMIFYVIIAILAFSNGRLCSKLAFVLNVLANFGSIYLAFILYLLRDICVVCVGTYLVNLIILLLFFSKLKCLNNNSKKIN